MGPSQGPLLLWPFDLASVVHTAYPIGVALAISFNPTDQISTLKHFGLVFQ